MGRKKKSEELVNWECTTYMELRQTCYSVQEIATQMTNLSNGRNYTAGYLYTILIPKILERGFKRPQVLFEPDKGSRKKVNARSAIKKNSAMLLPALPAIDPVLIVKTELKQLQHQPVEIHELDVQKFDIQKLDSIQNYNTDLMLSNSGDADINLQDNITETSEDDLHEAEANLVDHSDVTVEDFYSLAEKVEEMLKATVTSLTEIIDITQKIVEEEINYG